MDQSKLNRIFGIEGGAGRMSSVIMVKPKVKENSHSKNRNDNESAGDRSLVQGLGLNLGGNNKSKESMIFQSIN